MSEGIHYIKYRASDGQILDFLVDTADNKNFICPSIAKTPSQTTKPFQVKSAGET